MISDGFVLRCVVVMGVIGHVGATLATFLFLVVIKAVSGSNVLETEDMFGPFGGKVFIWDEQALGVWSPFVAGEVGDQFGVSLYATFWLLFGDEVVTWLGFVGIKGTYDAGYDIEIHSITGHPKKLSFCFGPFPQFRSHTLGT